MTELKEMQVRYCPFFSILTNKFLTYTLYGNVWLELTLWQKSKCYPHLWFKVGRRVEFLCYVLKICANIE